MKPTRILVCAAMLAGCSHEASRENPLDPELTPAVAAVATVDDAAGTIALAWNAYAGNSRFGAYVVLRNQVQRTNIDTLALLTTRSITAYIDSTAAPNTAYEYRIAVRTLAGLEVPSEPVRVTGYAIEAVELLEPETDANDVEIGLRWRRFGGAGFKAYRVERRVVGEDDEFQAIHRTTAMADTAFADASIVPEARYIYQVVVEAAGQEWVSNRTGREGLALSDVLPLQAVADSIAGHIRIAWPMYGGVGFEMYQVLRSGPTGDVLVYESTAPTDTVFADSTARSGVVYTYKVLVRAANRVLTSAGIEAQVMLPVVDLQNVDPDAPTATASLAWSRYVGPRFQGYRVERRTAELAAQEVALIDDPGVTSWTDAGLQGNTRYFYRVVVVTDLGEELVSAERDEVIHPVLQSWPFDVAEDEYLRLYWDSDARLRVLLATEHRVRLLTLDSAGGVVSEQVLWEHESLLVYPESASTGLLADGSRVLCLRLPFLEDGMTALLQYDALGQQVLYERNMLTDHDMAQAEGVDGGWEVWLTLVRGFLDEVAVTASGQQVLLDDFDSPDNSLWDRHIGERRDGRFVPVQSSAAVLSRSDASWHDVSTSVEASIDPGGIVTARVTSDNAAAYLVAQVNEIRTLARWRLAPAAVTQVITLPILMPLQTPFVQRLGFVDGRPFYTLSQPPYFGPSADSDTRRASVAATGDAVAMLDGLQPAVFAPGQEPSLYPTLDGAASELRIWATSEGGQVRPWIGACLPDQHQVRFSATSYNRFTGLGWPLGFFSKTLGTLVGQLPGSFLFPLSLAGSADGRIYVLDAGNARVQVFGLDGEYITQWGRAGTAAGEFDFGSGLASRDFAGSIAVDDDGFIYVADVGNGRIQRFAP